MMRVRVDDAEIDVETAGSGDAIVTIAGFPLAREIWDAQVAELARGAFAIRPDLRGMGASSVPDGPYLMETLAGDIAAVLDALGIERAAIVGHSLGGYVAMAFCRMYTERVTKLALVCSRLAADTPQAARDREALADRVEETGSIDPVIDAYLPRLFAPDAPAGLVARTREIARKTSARGAAAMLRGMAQRVGAYDIAEDLDMPVLIVAGAQDAVVAPEEAERVRAAFPRADLLLVDGAGHSPMLERPEVLTAALCGFAGRD